MQIVQLLGCFPGRPHVEVVVARLPKGALAPPLGYGQFQRLDGARQTSFARFVDEQMHMLRHDHVSDHRPRVTLANSLEGVLE